MIAFRLPSLGSDMDEGTLVRWQVAPGDTVHKGQVVAVVDTAKAAIDVECWDEGTVDRLLVEPGRTLPVGAALLLLRGAGETTADVERAWAAEQAAAGRAPAAAPPGSARAVPIAPAPSPSPSPSPMVAAGVRISPAARRFAQEHGIDLAQVTPRGGVISLADLQPAAPPVPPVPPVPAAPPRADAMRRVIAAAMARSKREIPHYYLAEDVPFERASAWLAERNAALPPARRLLPAALLVKSVALALRRHPGFNGFWRDDRFVPGAGIHVGVAIALRGGGLVAPALHDADGLGVDALTRALLDLVQRARAGALRSSELGEATITVTSLGDDSVGSVFGVIHPPQVALVGFGRIAPRPWACDDGSLRALPVVTATLSADHRAGDGHAGARLLAEIRDRLQTPEELAP